MDLASSTTQPVGWDGAYFATPWLVLGALVGFVQVGKLIWWKCSTATVWWAPPRSGKRENCATGCKLRRRRWKIKINRLGKEEVMKCPRDSVAFFWYDLIFVPILKLCWGKTCNYYHMESLLFQRSNLFFLNNSGIVIISYMILIMEEKSDFF